MVALHSTGTGHLVSTTNGKSPSGFCWGYKFKIDPDGQVDRLKARLVTKGFTKIYGLDYYDIFSPIAKIASIRLLLSMVAMSSLPPHQLNIKNGFRHGDLVVEVYIEQPPILLPKESLA